MIFGGVARERLQLNEDTLYAGGPYDPSNPDALAALPKVRALIAEGKYEDAQNLAQEKMMARPIRMPSYQTVGDLILGFGASAYAQDYRRELNLDTACAGVRCLRDGVTLTRESFASAVDQVIVTRITADRPGALDFRASFETPMPGAVVIDDGHLVLNGRNVAQQGIDGKLRFQARVAVIPQGGKLHLSDGEFVISGADSALVLVAIATSFRRFDDVSGDPESTTRAQINAATAKSFEALRAAHVADHQKLFRRVAFELPATPASEEPTNIRIRDSQTSDDPQLAALYFQYARYLLLGCSRPGTQPANLQGLWNDKLLAPWGSKYTININTEMNYWPAEPANLAECVQPLVAMVKDLAVTGAVTARTNYGARGWVAHHNTDLWRATGPIDGAFWGMWPTGGAWLCKAPLGSLRLRARSRVSRRRLSTDEGRRAVLSRHAGRRPFRQVPGHEPVDLPREPPSAWQFYLCGSGDGQPDPARPLRQLHPCGGNPREGRRLPQGLRCCAREAPARPDR
jgi:alpha-L-fucosidase 2